MEQRIEEIIQEFKENNKDKEMTKNDSKHRLCDSSRRFLKDHWNSFYSSEAFQEDKEIANELYYYVMVDRVKIEWNVPAYDNKLFVEELLKIQNKFDFTNMDKQWWKRELIIKHTAFATVEEQQRNWDKYRRLKSQIPYHPITPGYHEAFNAFHNRETEIF